jgi:hypothetical protein
MLYDPADHSTPEETKEDFKQHSKIYERFMEAKQSRFLSKLLKRNKEGGTGGIGRSLLRFFNF